MSAFVPTDLRLVLVLAAALLALSFGGYALMRTTARPWVPKLGWLCLVTATVVTERLFASEPPGVRMVALIVVALSVLKLIAVAVDRVSGMPPLSFPAWLGFLAAWLGMRPRLFTSYGGPPLEGARALLRRGAVNLALGIVLVVLARGAWELTESRLVTTIPLLTGLSLVLHFGIGTLLAGAWRLRGVPADAVFREPLRSESLAEFWSRRWNLGFSEMIATLIYRPLSARIGRNAALLAGFFWSGLLHEMAISVPVRAGFGLPTLYFVLHGLLVWVERRLSAAGRRPSGWSGRACCLCWLLVPLPLLFHPPFLAGVVWPLVGIPSEQSAAARAAPRADAQQCRGSSTCRDSGVLPWGPMLTPKFWDERYSRAASEYLYGTEPSDFLAERYAALPDGGEVLCLADGEGRNGVFLATRGMRVTGVDSSAVGLAKAERLAAERGVAYSAVVADLLVWDLGEARWDGVVSIWAHLPAPVRADLHPRLARALRPGGVLLLEHYHPRQIGYGTGGPDDPTMMLTLEELDGAFSAWDWLHAFEGERVVVEGNGHGGKSYVTQAILRKPSC